MQINIINVGLVTKEPLEINGSMMLCRMALSSYLNGDIRNNARVYAHIIFINFS
jgi:hypothetical protein